MAIQREKEKRIIKEYADSTNYLTPEKMENLLLNLYSEDAKWYAPFPFKDVNGPRAIMEEFYAPLLKSFPDIKKHTQFLIGGEATGKDLLPTDEAWVMSAGYFVGNFSEDFLDIPHTDRCVWMRFAEYYRFEGEKVKESYFFIDLVSLINQAGFRSLIPTNGPDILSLGPVTNDGVSLYNVDKEDSAKTLKLITDMCHNGLVTMRKVEGKHYTPTEETMELMRTYWHEDMMWYGPSGIGSSKGIAGFEIVHEIPWEMAWDIQKASTIKFADGNYGTCLGWPSSTAVHRSGTIFGIPATGKVSEFRLIDIWLRDGDKLLENWVWIDNLKILHDLGVDVLDKIKNRRYLVR